MTIKDKIELRDKILQGLELSYKNLIEFKKQHNSELVILRDGKIVKIKAKDL
ncbi:MAG: hypothetical protein LBT25_03260 [Candidatus Symbiothrix sp.]|jgi:adenylate cyclase|nr:hypothetical protein [Candidatus Symbiothrix sp.]